MKNAASAVLIFLTAFQASALTPSPNAVSELRMRYDPRIQIVSGVSSMDWGCPTRKYTVEGKDPLTLQPRAVRVRLYGTLKAGVPAVVIMPPTGGENLIDRSYARAFCSRELVGLIVEGWDRDNDVTVDLEMHDRNTVRALFAVEHAIEFLLTNGVGRIGILGTSVGAMTASMVLGFDSRVVAGALIVGGTDLPGIVSVSTEQTLVRLREQRMRELGYRDAAAYEAALRMNLRYDLEIFLEAFLPRPIFFVTATEDLTVPTKYQDLLRARLGSVNELRLAGDHSSVIFKTYWSYTGRIVDFLNKILR